MMKKMLMVLLVLLTACSPAVLPAPTQLSASTQASALQPVPSPDLLQFRMVDASLGWGFTTEAILRTQDGGATWVNVTPLGYEGYAYAPYFAQAGFPFYVYFPGMDYSSGVLLQTWDSGLTWTTSVVPFALISMQFQDQLNGYALADLGAGAGSQGVAIYHTADAGFSWQLVFEHQPGTNQSLPFSGQKHGMTFRDSTVGWIGGSIPMEGVIYLYMTSNGGTTWAPQPLALPVGYENAFTGAYPPVFFGTSNGLLPVQLNYEDGVASVLYRTSDGGSTWTAGQVVHQAGVLSILGAGDAALWNGGNTLFWTHDGGISWNGTVPNIDLSASLSMMQFIDPQLGWALSTPDGVQSRLLQTQDGGSTWTVLLP